MQKSFLRFGMRRQANYHKKKQNYGVSFRLKFWRQIRSMVNIQSATAEIGRGKKERNYNADRWPTWWPPCRI